MFSCLALIFLAFSVYLPAYFFPIFSPVIPWAGPVVKNPSKIFPPALPVLMAFLKPLINP
jgi:hypothetical protein